MKIVYKKDFLKSFSLFSRAEQELILEADRQIKLYIEGKFDAVSPGLRVKKIGPKTYEARANDRIRIIWIKDIDTVYFVLLGDHDEVRRYIKRF